MTRVCAVCSDEIPSRPIGRPRTYCSVACRRQMEAMKRELLGIEEQIDEVRLLAEHDFAPGTRSWNAQADWLEKAAAELRVRIR